MRATESSRLIGCGLLGFGSPPFVAGDRIFATNRTRRSAGTPQDVGSVMQSAMIPYPPRPRTLLVPSAKGILATPTAFLLAVFALQRPLVGPRATSTRSAVLSSVVVATKRQESATKRGESVASTAQCVA